MLSQEMTQLIGKTGETLILEVEKGAIKRFADAVGDRNPLYWDDEHARNSRYGSIVAPPGFFGWPTKWKTSMPFLPELREELITTITKDGYGRVLDGGMEFDFIQPIRAGDKLASVFKVIDIREREGKGGSKMILSVAETTYTNQYGDVVAKMRQTLIHR